MGPSFTLSVVLRLNSGSGSNLQSFKQPVFYTTAHVSMSDECLASGSCVEIGCPFCIEGMWASTFSMIQRPAPSKLVARCMRWSAGPHICRHPSWNLKMYGIAGGGPWKV